MGNDLFSVNDKVVLITGAAGGIGAAIATAFAQSGAQLVLADCNAKAMESLAKSLPANSKAHCVELRVEQRDQCVAAVDSAVDHFGRVDVLLNAAGVNTRMRPELYDQETWDRIININLGGTFNMCQAVFPHMKDRGGKIVNVGSIL